MKQITLNIKSNSESFSINDDQIIYVTPFYIGAVLSGSNITISDNSKAGTTLLTVEEAPNAIAALTTALIQITLSDRSTPYIAIARITDIVTVGSAANIIYSNNGNVSQKLFTSMTAAQILEAIRLAFEYKNAILSIKQTPIINLDASYVYTSGGFEIGKTYKITTLEVGDDFTGTGYVALNTPFIAIEQPVDWSNGSSVTELTRLTIGNKYQILTLEAGDDFANVGYINSTVFTATATTPTTWTNGTILLDSTASTPTIRSFENTFNAATITRLAIGEYEIDLGENIASNNTWIPGQTMDQYLSLNEYPSIIVTNSSATIKGIIGISTYNQKIFIFIKETSSGLPVDLVTLIPNEVCLPEIRWYS